MDEEVTTNKKLKSTVEVTGEKFLKLISRLNYAVAVKLTDGETIFIAPHGSVEKISSDLLDSTTLPTGIQFQEFQI